MTAATLARPKARAPEGEKNVHRLPRGEKLRRAMVDTFHLQRAAILRSMRAGRKDRIADNLPEAWPDWDDFGLGVLAISERMTPLIAATWDAAGAKFLGRIGLDPDAWDVTNPHLARMIDEATLDFCRSTNDTTSLALDVALARTREELRRGVVEEGESGEVLTTRINRIFDGAERWRARRIAQTETSRAVHAAQEQAAYRSGVVTGWEWLLSGDACPTCVAIAARARYVELGRPFAVIGENPHYSRIKFPPAHPHCNCTVVEVLDTDEQPAWADTLHQPDPASDAEHEAVARITQERDDETLGRRPRKPTPPIKPPPTRKPPRVVKPVAITRPVPVAKPVEPAWRWGEPIDPDRPIAERIEASPARERTKELAAANAAYIAAKEAAAAARQAYDELRDKAILATIKDRATDEEKAEWFRRVKEMEANTMALRKLRDDAKKDAEARTAELLGVPKGSPRFRWSPDDSGLKTDSSRKAAVEAGAFLGPILASGPSDLETKVGFKTIPKGKPQRAHCEDWRNEIHLKQTEDIGTAVHEWGHQIERSVAGVRAATEEFLSHRVGNEPPRKLKDVLPGRGYRGDEEGREDDFRKAFGDEAWYVGKHYKKASEIISMGLEKLYNDPGDFARKDPEYCSFILGILDGSLRKP